MNKTVMHNTITPPRFLLTAALGLLLAAPWAHGQTAPEEGFVSLFDGTSLDGWKIGENPDAFQVKDGEIVMEYTAKDEGPAHLFYEGNVHNHTFKNFDLRVDVKTYPYANSGIYFHAEFQASGWPRRGLECQVNNSHVDWRRTGSLYGIRNLSWGPETPPADNQEIVTLYSKPPVTDNVWYTQEIIYQNGLVTVKLNGETMFDYKIEDADTEHKLSTGVTWLPAGTFVLQGHPPLRDKGSKVAFKNIRVKILPD
jgi:hypothetical protein